MAASGRAKAQGPFASNTAELYHDPLPDEDSQVQPPRQANSLTPIHALRSARSERRAAPPRGHRARYRRLARARLPDHCFALYPEDGSVRVSSTSSAWQAHVKNELIDLFRRRFSHTTHRAGYSDIDDHTDCANTFW